MATSPHHRVTLIQESWMCLFLQWLYSTIHPGEHYWSTCHTGIFESLDSLQQFFDLLPARPGIWPLVTQFSRTWNPFWKRGLMVPNIKPRIFPLDIQSGQLRKKKDIPFPFQDAGKFPPFLLWQFCLCQDRGVEGIDGGKDWNGAECPKKLHKDEWK